MKNNKLLLSLTIISTVTIFACSKKDDDMVKDPPKQINEEEVITTMIVNLIDSAGVQPEVHAKFRDPDGDGGKGPDVFDTIRLVKNTTYLATITLLNETATPVDTISNEVKEEAKDHLFCFTPSGVDVSIFRTDTDGTFEVGLESKWITGGAGNGTVQITLKHQPDVKNGSCNPGETDVDVTFVTEVK